jgi:hypothetical protein
MNLKRGQVLRADKRIACGVFALCLAACSTSVELPSLGGPPEQPQDMDCAALNAERTRQRADLKLPLLSSETDAEREAEITQLNAKLCANAKLQSDKSCPAVANGPTGSVVR